MNFSLKYNNFLRKSWNKNIRDNTAKDINKWNIIFNLFFNKKKIMKNRSKKFFLNFYIDQFHVYLLYFICIFPDKNN